MLDKWDHRFLALAEHISNWSKDPSTQVGAVITHTRSKRVVSMGFNGFPAGVEDTRERLDDRETKYEMVVHAEQNALMFAGDRAEGRRDNRHLRKQSNRYVPVRIRWYV